MSIDAASVHSTNCAIIASFSLKYLRTFFCCRINISEVHRIYQILEEEDSIKFMSLIDDTSKRNKSKETPETPEIETQINSSGYVVGEVTEIVQTFEQKQEIIKTETKTGYVNIDGTEREIVKNESNLRESAKEQETDSYEDTINTDVNTDTIPEKDGPMTSEANVEVDDIIVPTDAEDLEKLQPPSVTKAKEAFKMLPKVIQDFLNSDWRSKSKCEPQRLLEKIRREKQYPDHPDVDKYELLLTPAPSFLQRISLAGEFFSKKHLEL